MQMFRILNSNESLFARAIAYQRGGLGFIPGLDMSVSGPLVQDGDDRGPVYSNYSNVITVTEQTFHKRSTNVPIYKRKETKSFEFGPEFFLSKEIISIWSRRADFGPNRNNLFSIRQIRERYQNVLFSFQKRYWNVFPFVFDITTPNYNFLSNLPARGEWGGLISLQVQGNVHPHILPLGEKIKQCRAHKQLKQVSNIEDNVKVVNTEDGTQDPTIE